MTGAFCPGAQTETRVIQDGSSWRRSARRASVLNKEGEQGWRLRELVTDGMGAGRIYAVLERERS